ncbi:LamG domain-containing protein [Kitasatospora camelliae]|uniref:LamG domain-containing protein n=1 Tax=Kitasatospora camelliae TaxID=3156397 RepID=A0AAU8K5J5_9ACTN
MTDGTGHPHGTLGQQAPWQPGPPPPAFGQPSAFPPPGAAAEPDWAALADRNEAQGRRRRVWIVSAVSAVCVLGIVAGAVALTSHRAEGGGQAAPSTAASPPALAFGDPSAAPEASPAASASGTPSASASVSATAAPSGKPAASASGAATRAPVTTPTVPGKPTLLADHAGHADLTMSGEAGLKPVSGGHALSLRGTAGSYAQSAGPLVDTGRSFTASAWVYLDAADGPRTVISQGDGAGSSFDLTRDDAGGQKAWTLRVQTAGGGAESTVVQARAVSPAAAAGQWVLVTGAYDAGQKTVTLYVNGASAASAKVPGIWAGSGPLELGRSRRQNAWTAPWAGVIGHIQLWDKALTPAEIAKVKSDGGAGPASPPLASWLV